MRLILSLACDDARLRPDGKLDVRGQFQELSAPGFPAIHRKMTVVFVMEWPRDLEGSVPFRADLVDANGQKVLAIQGHTEVHRARAGGAPAVTKLVQELEDVVFPAPGQYHFVLTARGKSIDALPLHVVPAAEPASGPGRGVAGN